MVEIGHLQRLSGVSVCSPARWSPTNVAKGRFPTTSIGALTTRLAKVAGAANNLRLGWRPLTVTAIGRRQNLFPGSGSVSIQSDPLPLSEIACLSARVLATLIGSVDKNRVENGPGAAG